VSRAFLIAAEPSGDALGAELAAALRAMVPGTVLGGVGGSAMAAAGVESAVPIEGLAILGFLEGLKALETVEARADATAAACTAFKPDIVVLIDSWGFTLRCAQRIRPLLPSVPLVKMVGPQVWATRPGRARTVAAAYDALLCIHAFEVPFYEGLGIPVTVIGNPAVARTEPGNPASFTSRHSLEGRRQLLLLPGSRPSEIERVAPVLEAAAARLCAARPDLTVTSVVAPAVETAVRARAAGWRFPHLLVGEAEKADAFAAATAALACSGTVTTEVAMQGTPVVVGYRLGWVTWAIARAFLMKSRFITLMNVAAGAEIAPEFVQTRCTPARLAAATARLLDDPSAAQAQRAAQNSALTGMGRGGVPAARRAAAAIAALLAARRTR
jgi:lipid-A-disaccharide synthase